ncbi:MAG: hypothetical protein RL698_1915 [Pseudomonadota bacterium]|jgi:hypothetical protein
MRMLLPPVSERRAIDRLLSAFFREHRPLAFRQALSRIARYYRLSTPRYTWFEYLDWGKSGGRTYENGQIHLVHPEHWKRGRKYNSERQWINMIYHEMGHYILWTDAERKADAFAASMVRGIGPRRRAAESGGAGVEAMPSDRVGAAMVARRRAPYRAEGRTRAAGPRRQARG